MHLLLEPKSEAKASYKDAKTNNLACDVHLDNAWATEKTDQDPSDGEEKDDCQRHEYAVSDSRSVQGIEVEHDGNLSSEFLEPVYVITSVQSNAAKLYTI